MSESSPARTLAGSCNHGLYAELSFFRTADGLECDLLYPTPEGLAAIEIKAGAGISGAWFTRLRRIQRALPAVTSVAVVYAGSERQQRTAGDVVPLGRFAEYLTTASPGGLTSPRNPQSHTARDAVPGRHI